MGGYEHLARLLTLGPTELLNVDEGELAQFAFLCADEFSADMISVHAADGTYLYASRSAHGLLGYSGAELRGRNPYDFFAEEDVARLRANHASHQLEGTPSEHTIRYRLVTRSGARRWVETRSRAYRANGVVQLIIAVTRDVHEAVLAELRATRAEEEARDVQQLALLGRLAGAVGHELASPLLAAIVGVEYVAQNFALDADARAALADAASGLRRAEVVMSELRLLAGLVPTPRDGMPVRLDECVSHVLSLVGPWDELRFDFRAMPTLVVGDVARVHQLVFQLVTLHAGGQRPGDFVVQIECGSTETGAELVVKSRCELADGSMRLDVLGVLRGEAMPMATPVRLLHQLAESVSARCAHTQEGELSVTTIRFAGSADVAGFSLASREES